MAIDINEPVEQGFDLVVTDESGTQRLVGDTEFAQLLADGQIEHPPPLNLPVEQLVGPDIDLPGDQMAEEVVVKRKAGRPKKEVTNE